AHDQSIEMLPHVGAMHEKAREQLFAVDLALLIGRERVVLRLSELTAQRDHLRKIERWRLFDGQRFAIDARDVGEVAIEPVQAARARPAPEQNARDDERDRERAQALDALHVLAGEERIAPVLPRDRTGMQRELRLI